MSTNFITETYRYADMFDRPRTPMTLLGSASERLFALCPGGWAFSDDGFYLAGREKAFHIDARIWINGQEVLHDGEFYHAWGDELSGRCDGVRLTAWRYISPDDCACFVLSVANEGEEEVETAFQGEFPEMRNGYEETFADEYDCCSFMARGLGARLKIDGEGREYLADRCVLKPGEKKVFRLAVACAADNIDCEAALDAFLNAEDPIKRQIEAVEARYRANIPYFECSDDQITRIWYYRWLIYINQIRRTPTGFRVVTEFIKNVEWAGRYNTIVCPAGHHMKEGRWLRDGGVMDDYARFWVELSGEGKRWYTFWISDSLFSISKATGRFDYAFEKLDRLATIYRYFCSRPLAMVGRGRGYKPYLAENGLFQQIDSHDGAEYSISGRPWRYDRPRADYRPQINSCMCGDAKAIAQLAHMKGDDALAEEFDREADRVACRMDEALWDEQDGFYKTVNSETGEKCSACEEKGYFPWYFDIPGPERDCAWDKLADEAYFKTPVGITTAQRSHPHYMRNLKGERFGENEPCTWNGQVWAFDTCMTLTGLANRIDREDGGTPKMREMWLENMRTYARSHDKDGYPWLGEGQDPDSGAWVHEREHGLNYNHSSFCDLVITGLVGLRPQADQTVRINPVIPGNGMDWFCLENVPYHGHLLTILYDADGSRYGQGKGLILFVDGEEVARRSELGLLEYVL